MSDETNPEPDGTGDGSIAKLVEILTELANAAARAADVAKTLRETMDAERQAEYNAEAKRLIDIYNGIATSATAVKDAESELASQRMKSDGTDASRESRPDSKNGSTTPKTSRRKRVTDDGVKEKQAASDQRRRLREQETAHIKQQLEQRAADYKRYVEAVSQQTQLLHGRTKRPSGGHGTGNGAKVAGPANLGKIPQGFPVTSYGGGEPDYDEDGQPNEGFLRRNRDRLRRNRALRAADSKRAPGAPRTDPMVTGKLKRRADYVEGNANRRRAFLQSRGSRDAKLAAAMQEQAATNMTQSAPGMAVQGAKSEETAPTTTFSIESRDMPHHRSTPATDIRPSEDRLRSGSGEPQIKTDPAGWSSTSANANEDETTTGAKNDVGPRRESATRASRATVSTDMSNGGTDLSDMTQQVSDAVAQSYGAQGKRDQAILNSLQTVLQWLGQVKDQASNTAQIAETMSSNARARAQA